MSCDLTPCHNRPERQDSSASYDDHDYPYEPVDAPLSRVDWSHESVLRLSGCDLPQPREWTLADIGKEVRSCRPFVCSSFYLFLGNVGGILVQRQACG